MATSLQVQVLQAVQRIQTRCLSDGDRVGALASTVAELCRLTESPAGALVDVFREAGQWRFRLRTLHGRPVAASDLESLPAATTKPPEEAPSTGGFQALQPLLCEGQAWRGRLDTLPRELTDVLPDRPPWEPVLGLAMGGSAPPAMLVLLMGRPQAYAHTPEATLAPLLACGTMLLATEAAGAGRYGPDPATDGSDALADCYGLMEALPSGVLVARQGQLVYANPAAAAALGYPAVESLLALEVPDAWAAPEDRDRLDALLLSGGPPRLPAEPLELRGQRLDGAPSWLQCRARPVVWGGAPAVALLLEDVTERHRNTQETASQQRLLQTVFDALPYPLSVKDSALRYRIVNRVLAEHAGMQPEQILGRTVEVLNHLTPEAHRQIEAQDRQVLATGQPEETSEFRSVLHSGEEVYQTLLKYPLRDDRGRVEGLVGLAIDFTHNVQVQRHLKSQQRLLMAVLDAIPHTISVKDRAGRYIMVNKEFAMIAGRPVEELIGTAVDTLDCVGPNLLVKLRAMDSEVLADGEVCMSEDEPILLPDGTTAYRQFVKAPFLDEAERPGGVVTVGLKVSDRVTAQQRLRENQSMLQAVFDTIPHLISVKDREGRYVMANPAYRAIYGADPERLVGHTAAEVLELPPDQQATIAKEDAQILGGSAPELQTERFVTLPDGRKLCLDVHKAVLRDADGRPNGLVSITMDVTERREAERLAQLAHMRLRDAIESLPAVFFQFDPDERLVLWNSEASRFLPELAGHLRVGMTFLDIARLTAPHHVRAESTDDYLRERIVEFRGAESQGYRQRTDGRWVQYFDRRTSDGGTVSLRFDVTELKTREAELRQAYKMEAVGQLTGGVAHDFNNLLTVIVGNLELLKRELRGHGKAGEVIERALAAGERGAALTQRLLAFSRIQTLRPRPTDFNALVRSMHELLRRTLGATIEVHMELAPDLWTTQIDPVQLENALLNLAINARDAMPNGGRLTIETANTWLDVSFTSRNEEVQPGPYVLLAVSDTGCGVQPDLLERVFDPFFTTKEVGKGSGLGLSMVYGFVRQSAGYVRLYSEVGQGTTVRLYLPRAPGAADLEAPTGSGSTVPRGHGQRVLIVEDDPHISMLAQELLLDLGYTTLLAEDAPQAVAILEREANVEVLFTDVVLPGGRSGIDLAKDARRMRPALRVLFTTGYTEGELMRRSLIDHDALLLEKPYRRSDLADKLHRVLRVPMAETSA